MCDYIIVWSLQPTDTECDSPGVLHLYRLRKYFPVPYDLIESEMHCSNARVGPRSSGSLTSSRDGDAAGRSCVQDWGCVAAKGPWQSALALEILSLEMSDNTQ